MESPPPQPLPAPPDHAQYHVWNLRSPTNLPEAHICRNIPPICDYHGDDRHQILTYEPLDNVFLIRKDMIVTVLWGLSDYVMVTNCLCCIVIRGM